MRIGTWLFVGLLAAACGDDRSPAGDAGRTIMVDGGARDSGGSRDSGGGSMDTGGGCAPMVVPLPEGNVCAAATLTCLMGATTVEAQQACIMMDPAPTPCQNCLDQEVASCATNPPASCSDEFGNVVCCTGSMCAGLMGMALQTCIQTMCVTALNAFTGCVRTAGCAMITTRCFMSGGMARPEIGEPRLEAEYSLDDAAELTRQYVESHR